MRSSRLFAIVVALVFAPCAAPAEAPRPARPMGSAGESWREAPFFFVSTELSPMTLYRSGTDYLAFFADLAELEVGGPTFAAFAEGEGAHIVRRGERAGASAMSECWVLVWFAGAEGRPEWDSPWAVFLQRRPRSIALDREGLLLEFDGAAGHAALMPLYGYYKPPQWVREGPALYRRVPLAYEYYRWRWDDLGPSGASWNGDRAIRTWEWESGLPEEVLARLRYWARVSREFPIYCEDSFRVDRAADTVTIRQRFEWITIPDEWGTPPLKLAPISPPLALAHHLGGFPVQFSVPVTDPELLTPFGPYMGCEGVDYYDIHLPVLQYVHQAEAADPPQIDAHPTVAAALARLQAVAREKFPRADGYIHDHGGMHNFCWAIMGDRWYAKGLPYYDEETRRRAIGSLGKYFREDVLAPERFIEREYPAGSGRTYLILEGPGIGSWGILGDAGKFSSNLLVTLWAYAHHSGDWELIAERWDLVRRLFCTGAEVRWTSFGRESLVEMGDQAAPALALARLAYGVGDLDTYAYACSIFARELVHHFVKQRGAQYFRVRQPWHTTEPMPEEVYLTNVWGGMEGWRIDGPTYPWVHGERQYSNRWVRFSEADVARFYRDHLRADARRELDLLLERLPRERRWHNESHILPSLLQLRSLLLDESPAELAQVATPDQFTGPPSGVIASCISVLRTSRPARLERIIPPGPPVPFTVGVEREAPGATVCLTQAVMVTWPAPAEGEGVSWPLVTWWGWESLREPERAFGRVRPTRASKPGAVAAEWHSLNWNAAAVCFSLP